MKTKTNKSTSTKTSKLLGYINFKLMNEKVDEVSGAISIFANNRQSDQWMIGLVEGAKKGKYGKDFSVVGEAGYFKPKNKEVSHGYFLFTVMDMDGNLFTSSKSILKNPKMANDNKLLKWFKANKKQIKKQKMFDLELYPVGLMSKKQLKQCQGNF